MPRTLLLAARFCLPLASLASAQSVDAGKRNVNTEPYPLGNPVIHHLYTADAAPHVLPDGRVWMVTSVDSDAGGGYETMHEYHTFSSADLRHWTDHGRVFHIDDVRVPGAPAADKYALWAPDLIYRHGKYYLYYPVRILHSDQQKPDGGRVTTSYIGVAVSDSPAGPFTVANPHIEGTSGIDPAVFIDDDGQAYLYWGAHRAARLADNMTELADQPQQIELDTDRFMEAIWMHKHDGRYYVNYHTKYDWQIRITAGNRDDPARAKSELAYSVGDSPLGPFTYGGILNHELGVDVPPVPRSPAGDFVPWRLTQSNHGGIVAYHGRDYLFYHTSALSSWRQDRFQAEGTWTQRSVCVDRIDYAADGAVIPVQQTISGPPPVCVDQPYAILPVPGSVTGVARSLDGSVTLTAARATLDLGAVDLGSGYYYFDLLATGSTAPARIEVRRGSATGPLLGTVLVNREPAPARSGVYETFLRAASGAGNVVLVVTGVPGLSLSNFRFYAGAPQPPPSA